ncbi:MAG: endonuclease MutS2, partial [Candidatus Baltobacteraceae bacterium]
DTREATGAAARGTRLSGQELREVAQAISAAAAVFNKLRESSSEILSSIVAHYRPLRELQSAIVDAIDERGVVLDRASPALNRIRRNVAQANADARDRVAAMLRSPKYAKAIQDSVVTIREGRFVVPIKAEFSGEFPGIVHDTSSSGQTLFVEPLAALESNNRLRTLRIEEEHEVARVLDALSRAVGAQSEQIEINVDMLAIVDVLVAKAAVAQAMNAIAPELLETPELAMHGGRHPLLADRAIPQSLTLDTDRRLVVISGPNMGGKTVALKMVGLFVAMTYCGMQIPTEPGTQIGRFDRIFTDIGDEQSIAENASTFSAHLKRMREIIADADERTLVLVDEIGGGTEPNSGAALAIAMLERLLAVRACGIVTTHSTELKLFAHAAPGVTNASVRFDPKTFAPTYQLDVGTPGQSLAFPLARALGIPNALLVRAEELLESRERDYEQALAELSNLNATLEHQRDQLDKERTHLIALQDNLRKRTDALESERRVFSADADARLRRALGEFTAELGRRAEANATKPRVTSAQSALLSRVIDEMHRDLGVKPPRGNETADARFSAGDRVRVLSFNQEGSVLADNGQSVLVAIGSMKTSVQKSDLHRIGGAPKRIRGDAKLGEAKMAAASAAMVELDVRGKRFIEAEPLVDRWIDEATLVGTSPLRLIHGKGTGMLGSGLQQYLKEHPSVKNVRYGDENEGGGGVTVFELR